MNLVRCRNGRNRTSTADVAQKQSILSGSTCTSLYVSIRCASMMLRRVRAHPPLQDANRAGATCAPQTQAPSATPYRDRFFGSPCKTSLQKRTAETPSAQRVKKRTTRDAWRSIPVHDAIRKPPLRTPRRCGEIPFCSGLNLWYNRASPHFITPRWDEGARPASRPPARSRRETSNTTECARPFTGRQCDGLKCEPFEIFRRFLPTPHCAGIRKAKARILKKQGAEKPANTGMS